MIAIGFDRDAEALVIGGSQVFPAGTLRATVNGSTVRIASIAGRVEFNGPWTMLTRLDGTLFADCGEAMEYITTEFAREADVPDLLAIYILAKS